MGLRQPIQDRVRLQPIVMMYDAISVVKYIKEQLSCTTTIASTVEQALSGVAHFDQIQRRDEVTSITKPSTQNLNA